MTMERLGDGSGLPQRFADAQGTVRRAIRECEAADIPTDTILAALMSELMPRMVGAYGAHRVISVLTDLAAHIAVDVSQDTAVRH